MRCKLQKYSRKVSEVGISVHEWCTDQSIYIYKEMPHNPVHLSNTAEVVLLIGCVALLVESLDDFASNCSSAVISTYIKTPQIQRIALEHEEQWSSSKAVLNIHQKQFRRSHELDLELNWDPKQARSEDGCNPGGPEHHVGVWSGSCLRDKFS